MIRMRVRPPGVPTSAPVHWTGASVRITGSVLALAWNGKNSSV